MTYALYILDNKERIAYALNVANNPRRYTSTLSEDQIALQQAFASQYDNELIAFEMSAMRFVPLFYAQWMYVFQLFYQGTYAGRNKRVMKFFQPENMLDVFILFATMAYLIILLRDYRYGTFLSKPEPVPEARQYFFQYTESPVNENAFLFIVGTFLWMKAFFQLRFIKSTGYLYEVVRLLFGELLTFLFFYSAVLFFFALIGIILFPDIPEFGQINTALFTLFRGSVGDFDIKVLSDATEHYLGTFYFTAFAILNVVLLFNLIVA